MKEQRRRRWLVVMLGGLVSVSLTACGPAVQPMSSAASGTLSVLHPTKSGTLVSPAGWLTLAAGAQAGAQVQYYKEQLSASIVEGSLHSTFSVYGSLNLPDKASLALQEGNTSTNYFQQGKVAYYYDNGHWSNTSAITNLNVYPSYAHLIRQASAANIPLYQQKRTYVFDEYCDVYTSVLPVSMLSAMPDFGAAAKGQSGQVAVTWYLGQTDHVLRKVDMQTVGGVPDIGSMQVNASMLVFDINSSLAKVSVPKDLIKQLEDAKN
jgi:hypothetical protein